MIAATKNVKTTARKTATIFDVARLAGVSIKTVSRVANGQPNVRAQTRIHVQAAIDELEYQANPYARYLSARRSQQSANPAREITD